MLGEYLSSVGSNFQCMSTVSVNCADASSPVLMHHELSHVSQHRLHAQTFHDASAAEQVCDDSFAS